MPGAGYAVTPIITRGLQQYGTNFQKEPYACRKAMSAMGRIIVRSFTEFGNVVRQINILVASPWQTSL